MMITMSNQSNRTSSIIPTSYRQSSINTNMRTNVIRTSNPRFNMNSIFATRGRTGGG
jgi:hypothetical protein